MFADPNMAVDATFYAGGSSEGIAVRIIRSSPDIERGFAGTQIVTGDFEIEVMKAAVPALGTNDVFEVGDERLVIAGAPLSDAEGLVWRAPVRIEAV
ncbi:hypothetical protein [Pseudoroseicyclus sp. CXY001]|uniref:head-tail joining protein n=1 Tax=Pseudoroseicyclus sp. CXY001 TaxID=3242492 RepID=UPI003570BCC5